MILLYILSLQKINFLWIFFTVYIVIFSAQDNANTNMIVYTHKMQLNKNLFVL